MARCYRAAALFLLNTIVALVLLNLVLWLPLRLLAEPPRVGPVVPGSSRYAAAVQSAVADGAFRKEQRFYPRLAPEDVAALMLESWLLRPYVYEPFTQFKEGPYQGRFVTVDTNGFRQGRRPAPWPPVHESLNVFVFGGSTTFGYGLPDGETIPAHLEDVLTGRTGRAVRVYNFGRGYYFSTQERVLFEQLLAAGVVPDVAVFVDGLNDFYNRTGEPEFTGRLRAAMTPAAEPAAGVAAVVRGLPLARAAAWLGERARALRHRGPVASREATRPRAPLSREAAEPVVGRAIARFLENKRLAEAAAAAHGVSVMFAWQPVPTYRCDLRCQPAPDGGFGPHEYSRYGYPKMAELAAGGRLGDDFLWCADVQEGRRPPLYIDQVHYTPAMARRVAGCIAKGLARRLDISTSSVPTP